MRQADMRFCGYTFPHNPEKVKHTQEKNISEHTVPFSENIIQDLGKRPMIISGEGEFYGESCFTQYENLLWLYNKKKTGILSMPRYEPIMANFAALTLTCEPKDNLIAYRFTFTEDVVHRAKENSTRINEHVVKEGETLWHISNIYNVPVNKLMANNRFIFSPNEVPVGSKVKIL